MRLSVCFLLSLSVKECYLGQRILTQVPHCKYLMGGVENVTTHVGGSKLHFSAPPFNLIKLHL